MRTRRQRDPACRQQQRVVMGAIVIVVGFVALLGNLGWIDVRLVRVLWPLALVLGGVMTLQRPHQTPGGILAGAGLVVVGAAMTMSALGWMSFRWRDWWPVFLIGAGILMLVRRSHGRRRDGSVGDVDGGPGVGPVAKAVDGAAAHAPATSPRSDASPGTSPGVSPFAGAGTGFAGPSAGMGPAPAAARPGSPPGSRSRRLDATAILSGSVLRNDVPDLEAGELTAVMGGLEIDLRQAGIAGTEAVLQVFAMWGGITLKVPPGWSIEVRGVPILGGIEDKTVPSAVPGPRLVIEGYVVMGGVEIRN